MASQTTDLEDENKGLRNKNSELVQKVQHWKMLAAQRENEKLDLMKEMNEMRLVLARLRNNGNVLASKLDTALQAASEKALAHLVRASGEIALIMDLTKTYMRECKEVEAVSTRWSAIGGTPKAEKEVHRVPPVMIGGQFIQPVVSLSRTLLNTSNPIAGPRTAQSPNQNRNVTERAVPMHVMLQDVYIPLTRVDVGEAQATNMEMEEEADSEGHADDSELDSSSGHSEIEASQEISDDDLNASRLDAVAEDMEPEEEVETTPIRHSRGDNPLEGPSWLLDAPTTRSKIASQSHTSLEPDSTTEVEDITTPVRQDETETERLAGGSGDASAFSPTVRRRKRTSPPPPPSAGGTPRGASHYSPRPPHKRNSSSGRVLKVMVAKLRLECASPAAKRAAVCRDAGDAPSPNGATVPGVIVSEASRMAMDEGASGEPERRHGEVAPSGSRRQDGADALNANVSQERGSRGSRPRRQDISREVSQERGSRDSRPRRQDISSRYGSHDSRDSDSGSGGDPHNEGRTRRTRNKVVSYQEKPLNRKMRR